MTDNATSIKSSGLPIFSSSGGTFSAIDLTTKGDILTRTAANYVRLGIGANNKVLTCDSTQSSGLIWNTVTGKSSLIFLESQIANNSASVIFTSAFDDSTYLYYLFTYANIHPADDEEHLLVRFSVNGGSSYLTSNYRWVYRELRASDGDSNLESDDSDSSIELAEDLGDASGEGLSGKMIFIPSTSPSSSNPGEVMYDNVYVEDNGKFYRNIGAGINTTSSVINGIKFYMSSGNIVAGNFYMYGFSKT